MKNSERRVFLREVLSLPSDNEFTQANLGRYCLLHWCLEGPPTDPDVTFKDTFLKKGFQNVHVHVLLCFYVAKKYVLFRAVWFRTWFSYISVVRAV